MKEFLDLVFWINITAYLTFSLAFLLLVGGLFWFIQKR